MAEQITHREGEFYKIVTDPELTIDDDTYGYHVVNIETDIIEAAKATLPEAILTMMQLDITMKDERWQTHFDMSEVEWEIRKTENDLRKDSLQEHRKKTVKSALESRGIKSLN